MLVTLSARVLPLLAMLIAIPASAETSEGYICLCGASLTAYHHYSAKYIDPHEYQQEACLFVLTDL